jgi:hypothetical protein
VAWMSVCCECCLLSGRGLCDELITLREESYRLWRVVVCDLETLWMRRPWPTGGCRAKKQTNKQTRWRYLNSFLQCYGSVFFQPPSPRTFITEKNNHEYHQVLKIIKRSLYVSSFNFINIS